MSEDWEILLGRLADWCSAVIQASMLLAVSAPCVSVVGGGSLSLLLPLAVPVLSDNTSKLFHCNPKKHHATTRRIAHLQQE
jgi:hypothetical protein